jgi:hypothetical protein
LHRAWVSSDELASREWGGSQCDVRAAEQGQKLSRHLPVESIRQLTRRELPEGIPRSYVLHTIRRGWGATLGDSSPYCQRVPHGPGQLHINRFV